MPDCENKSPTQFANTMNRATSNELVRLQLGPLPAPSTTWKHQSQLLEDTWAFIGGLQWQLAAEQKPYGITWLELYIAFNLMGYNQPYTVEGYNKLSLIHI